MNINTGLNSYQKKLIKEASVQKYINIVGFDIEIHQLLLQIHLFKRYTDNKEILSIIDEFLTIKNLILDNFESLEKVEKDAKHVDFISLTNITEQLDMLYYNFAMCKVPITKDLNAMAKAYNKDLYRFKAIAIKYMNMSTYISANFETNVRVLFSQSIIIHCMLTTETIFIKNQPKFEFLKENLGRLMLCLEQYISKEEIIYYQTNVYYLASANYTQKIVLSQVVDSYINNPTAIKRITREILKIE